MGVAYSSHIWSPHPSDEHEIDKPQWKAIFDTGASGNYLSPTAPHLQE